MKKIFLLLTILLTATLTFAQNANNCVIDDKILSYEMHNILDSFVGSACTWEVKKKILQEKITKLNSVLKMVDAKIVAEPNPSGTSCQKISQALWYLQDRNSDRDADVARLERFLIKTNDLDYVRDKYEPNYMNSFPVDAVKRFQAKYGIKQTGAVGPVTLAKINSMICVQTFVTGSSPALMFTPNSDVQVVSNLMTFGLDWSLSAQVQRTDFEASKLYVILELVDGKENVVATIGDGWAGASRPTNYPLLNQWSKLPADKVRIRARLSYQPTMSGCDPNVRGECAPIYSASDQILINTAKKFLPAYTNFIKFVE